MLCRSGSGRHSCSAFLRWVRSPTGAYGPSGQVEVEDDQVGVEEYEEDAEEQEKPRKESILQRLVGVTTTKNKLNKK